MNLDDKTIARRFEIEYIYRDAPRYWAQMDFDCSRIGRGYYPRMNLSRYLTKYYLKLRCEIT